MSKHTYAFVRNQIEKEKGFKLLSRTYINAKTKLKVQCNKGHIYYPTYGHFHEGTRCPYCAKENQGVSQRHSYDYVKEQIESREGFKLLSKEYTNNSTKLKVQCNKRHKYEVSYANFRRGRGCPYCDGRAFISHEFIEKQMKKEGYKLLSEEYSYSNVKLEVRCPERHKYEVTWNNFQRGKRCPICDRIKTSSKGEKEVLQMVKRFTGEEVFENDRTQIINPLTGHNLELDIYIPSLNKAIEYNGTYWHSLPDRIIKDQEKVKQCKEKGIDLLIIKEEHWQGARILCERSIEQFLKREV